MPFVSVETVGQLAKRAGVALFSSFFFFLLFIQEFMIEGYETCMQPQDRSIQAGSTSVGWPPFKPPTPVLSPNHDSEIRQMPLITECPYIESWGPWNVPTTRVLGAL